MTDIVAIIFDRADRHPSVHEYGKDIDRTLDGLVGPTRLSRGRRDPKAPIRGFPAQLELHETGPIFLLDPHHLNELAPLLETVRALSSDWAIRLSGEERRELSVAIRYGPRAGAGGPDEYYMWQRVRITVDPATFAAHLDELLECVLRVGA